jgi:hypothetical protein
LQDEFPFGAVVGKRGQGFEVETLRSGVVAGEAVLGEEGTDVFGLWCGDANGRASYE